MRQMQELPNHMTFEQSGTCCSGKKATKLTEDRALKRFLAQTGGFGGKLAEKRGRFTFWPCKYGQIRHAAGKKPCTM